MLKGGLHRQPAIALLRQEQAPRIAQTILCNRALHCLQYGTTGGHVHNLVAPKAPTGQALMQGLADAAYCNGFEAGRAGKFLPQWQCKGAAI